MEFLDTDSDDGALDDSGSDSDDLRIEKILAVKNMTKAEWQKIMSVMNTAEVESGSMWFDGENEAVPSDTMFVERFLIKWQALSFVHVSWETREDLESQIGVQVKSQIKRFLGFKHFENKCFTQSERGDGEYFPLQFLEVDRVLDITDHNQNALDIPFTTEDRDLLPETLPKLAIATDKSNPKYEKNPGRRILIKWMDKGYSDSTYELERDLQLFNIEYDASTQLFLKRKRRMTQKAFNRTIDKHVDAIIAENKLYNFGHIADDEDSSLPSPDFHSKSADRQKTRAVNIANFEKRLEGREWKNGGSLRDYQAKGITWMYMQSLPKRIDKLSKEHEMNNRGVMLADEMGLGKTLQVRARRANRQRVCSSSLSIATRLTNSDVLCSHRRPICLHMCVPPTAAPLTPPPRRRSRSSTSSGTSATARSPSSLSRRCPPSLTGSARCRSGPT